MLSENFTEKVLGLLIMLVVFIPVYLSIPDKEIHWKSYDVSLLEPPIESIEIFNDTIEIPIEEISPNLSSYCPQIKIPKPAIDLPCKELVYLGEFKLTAYCKCKICCEGYAFNRPKDAEGNEIVYGGSGVALTAGISIAVDPRVIPYDSTIVINGQTYIAQDCGGAIKGNRIDIYMATHQETKDFGVQYADVYIVREKEAN